MISVRRVIAGHTVCRGAHGPSVHTRPPTYRRAAAKPGSAVHRLLHEEVVTVNPADQRVSGSSRVRELFARCRATSDHAERAALLAWAADELDATALGTADAETVVALQTQADRARRQAWLERAALVTQAAGGLTDFQTHRARQSQTPAPGRTTECTHRAAPPARGSDHRPPRH